MFRISACTIARNEAKNIRHWVNSVRIFADEIIVVDTGSTDETRELAREEGAVVYEFPWCSDFSAAKNFALDKASGDWVVMLDADEYFDEPSQKKLRTVLQKYNRQKKIAGFITPFLNIDVEQGGSILSQAWQMRVFRREKQLRFAGKVHESLQNYAIDGKDREFILLKDLQFIHTGYSRTIIKEKLQRNLQILLREIQEQGGEHPRQYGYLQDCYMGLEDYQKAIHYGLLALKHRQETGLMGQTNSIVCKLLNAMRLSGLADYGKELEKAAEAYPDLPEVYFFYGQHLLSKMEGAKARKALLKAKELYEKPLTSAEDIRNLTVGNMPSLINDYMKKIEKYADYYTAMEKDDFLGAARNASQYLRAAYCNDSCVKDDKVGSMKSAHSLLTSIVILNKDLLIYTKQLIESIRQYTEKGSYEIIVVDNGSQDGSVEWLQQQNDVRLIANKENAGFPKGCNQGMEIARGQEILLLNNDTVVTTNWLTNLRQALYAEPGIGAVGPVTNSCSNLQKIEIPYPNENDPVAMRAMQSFAAAYNKSDPRKWHKWMMLVGFCMLFKREVYEQIGGMDEAYSPGNFEDDDYSMRIRRAGYEILLCRDTFIHHFGSKTFYKLTNGMLGKERTQYDQYMQRNDDYFCQKWNLRKDFYHRYRTILPSLKFSDEPMRIIEYEAGSTMDLYILGSLCRQGDIKGTTSHKPDLEIGGSYPLLYAEDLGQFIDILEGEYQLIIIAEDIQKYGDKIQEIIEQIEKHLSIGGWMITVKDGQWLQMQKE
ncbi:glycosyltransferase [Selenomonas ruminantium]|uniref:glycosyltransferase n=1 Tax=Selenomonas ruminantium TaxID=971 RepID=UPI00040C1690|nr:glycosyltransferase [Selenomonas ruminantium]